MQIINPNKLYNNKHYIFQDTNKIYLLKDIIFLVVKYQILIQNKYIFKYFFSKVKQMNKQ